MALENEAVQEKKDNSSKQTSNYGKSGSFLDRNITINMKFLVILFLVAAAFLAGKFLFPSEPGITFNITDKLSGMFSSDSAASEQVSQPAAAAPNIQRNTSDTPDAAVPAQNADAADTAVENTVSEDIAPTSTTSANATINGGYSKIKLSFRRAPLFSWKGTWGKIETIYYTIENGEAGSIAPSKFSVLLEGYPDPVERPVPRTDTLVEEGEKAEHGFDISTSYSETVTDPTNLKLTLQLLDKQGQLMATAEKEFNLKTG